MFFSSNFKTILQDETLTVFQKRNYREKLKEINLRQIKMRKNQDEGGFCEQ